MSVRSLGYPMAAHKLVPLAVVPQTAACILAEAPAETSESAAAVAMTARLATPDTLPHSDLPAERVIRPVALLCASWDLVTT